MKARFRFAHWANFKWAVVVFFAALALAGCAAPDDFGDFYSTSKSGVRKVGASIVGVNHSQKSIIWFGLATGGGGSYSPKRWPGAGTSCCAVLPVVWTPDLKVLVEWETGDAPVRSKVVPIERYEKTGTVYVHFFDNDEVRIVAANVGADNPEHPIPWVPLPCEGTFRAGPDGREIFAPSVNCPPRKEE